jgi:hypothetical protein
MTKLDSDRTTRLNPHPLGKSSPKPSEPQTSSISWSKIPASGASSTEKDLNGLIIQRLLKDGDDPSPVHSSTKNANVTKSFKDFGMFEGNEINLLQNQWPTPTCDGKVLGISGLAPHLLKMKTSASTKKWSNFRPEKVTTNIWKLDHLEANPELSEVKS